ncbi:MAG: aminotransferase class IV [Bacteroidota bacterium]
MSRFLESIRLENGQLPLLLYHQSRVNHTILEFRKSLVGTPTTAKTPFSLKQLLKNENLPKEGLFKVRIVYGLTVERLEILPYTVRPINSLQVVDLPSEYDYSFKYTDRSVLNNAFEKRKKADDVLLIRDGFVTDSYYANTVFWKGGKAFVPDMPLLNGVRRKHLLDLGKVQIKTIRKDDIWGYEKVSLVNALLPLGTIEIPTHQIFA